MTLPVFRQTGKPSTRWQSCIGLKFPYSFNVVVWPLTPTPLPLGGKISLALQKMGRGGGVDSFPQVSDRDFPISYRTSDIRLPGTVSPSITWTTSSGVTGIAVTGFPCHSLRDTDVLAHSFLLIPRVTSGAGSSSAPPGGDGRRRMKRKESGREEAGMAIAGICVSQTSSFAPSPLRGRGGISSGSTRRKTGEARRRSGRRRR